MSLNHVTRYAAIATVAAVLCAGISARADFCVKCNEDFFCVGAEIGAQRCRAQEGFCYVEDKCPVEPPDPPPSPPDPPWPDPDPPPLEVAYEYYFEVSFNANLDDFPTCVPLDAGDNANEMRLEIATRAGIEQSDVVLKGGMFSVGSIALAPGKSATAAHGTGSMCRVDLLEGEWCRARICSGEIGGQPQLKADVELPPGGAIVLVPLTIRNNQVVAAYKINVVPEAVFESDPIGPQYSFMEDLKNNLGPDPYAISVGHMRATCN